MLPIYVQLFYFWIRYSMNTRNIRKNCPKMKVTRYILPLLFIASLAVSSCDKQGPADATVVVVDSIGKRVPGAVVVLRQDSVVNPTNGVQASINEMKVTDAAGQAFFTFKLEAVLILEAKKGALEGRDFIRLEQSKEVNKTVIIR